jgi:hypothetical protein
MPLSREEFEAGLIDLTIPIRQVLESRPDLSFSSEEIRELLLQSQSRNATYEQVVLALEQLVSEGRAIARVIEGSKWYTIVESETPRRIGFRQEG